MLAVLLAASLLAAAAPVRGDVITTDTYSCPTDCAPPECVCASNTPPAGLKPAQIPQFVLISHDNALNNLSYSLMTEVLGSKKQRNGCPVPVTWFAQRYHSECIPGQKALARGDEVAMQANRFYPTDPFNWTDPSPHYDSRDPKTGKPSVEIEITMSRDWWATDCHMPKKDMVGFRAQGLYNNPPVRETLSKDGYLYDATLIERYYQNSPTSPSADMVLWPYTMDGGIPQECSFLGSDIGFCDKDEAYSGLWEVPLYELQDGDNLYGTSNYGAEGAAPVDNMYDMLKSQLDQRLAGGRTPMEVNTYYEWLGDKPENPPAEDPTCIYCERVPSANAEALAKFIDYASKQEGVYFITFSDLIHWMQDPVTADNFDAWWDCKTPGVKANLAAVNLSATDLAGANTSLTGAAAAPAPAPMPADVPAPMPEMAMPPSAPSPAYMDDGAMQEGAPDMAPGPQESESSAPPPVDVSSGVGAAGSTLAAAAAAALAGLLLMAA